MYISLFLGLSTDALPCPTLLYLALLYPALSVLFIPSDNFRYLLTYLHT